MSYIPEELICPITLEIMDDPVLCEDEFTYERSAITDKLIVSLLKKIKDFFNKVMMLK